MTSKETQGLAVPEEHGIRLSPRAVLAEAQEQATVLMEVVKARKLFKVIDGRDYLEAEAWETILAFNNAHPSTVSTEPMEEDGETIGYIAHVEILKNGQRISSAFMPCFFDEFPCRGKEGTAKHRAAMSAAQTWALSKAAKLKFAWVAVLGGFAPTPAEEMDGVVPDEKSVLWCPEHKTLWFKSKKMRNYAHPIGETGQWCNQPVPAAPAPTTSATSAREALFPPNSSEPAEKAPAKPPGEAQGPSTGKALPAGPPKNVGELLTWCLNHFALTRNETLRLLNLTTTEQIASLADAWAAVKAHKGTGTAEADGREV